jgi:hypothetical protein
MPLPTTPKTPPKAVQAAELRWRLLQLGRYDDGAVVPAVYRVIREIETCAAAASPMSTAANWRVLEHALVDSFRSQGAHVEDADGDFLLPIIIETDDGYADHEVSLTDLARMIADEVRT